MFHYLPVPRHRTDVPGDLCDFVPEHKQANKLLLTVAHDTDLLLSHGRVLPGVHDGHVVQQAVLLQTVPQALPRRHILSIQLRVVSACKVLVIFQGAYRIIINSPSLVT